MGASRFVGRVGGLAVALGVGAAVFTGIGVAWADDSPSSDAGPKVTRQHDGNGSTASSRNSRAKKTKVSSTVVSSGGAQSGGSSGNAANGNSAGLDQVDTTVRANTFTGVAPSATASPQGSTTRLLTPVVDPAASTTATVTGVVNNAGTGALDPATGGNAPAPVDSPLALAAVATRRQSPTAAATPTASVTSSLVTADSVPATGSVAWSSGILRGSFANPGTTKVQYTLVSAPSLGGKIVFALDANGSQLPTGNFSYLPDASTLTSASTNEQFKILAAEVTGFDSFVTGIPLLGGLAGQIIVVLHQTPILGSLLAPIIGQSELVTFDGNAYTLSGGKPTAFTTMVPSVAGALISVNYFPSLAVADGPPGTQAATVLFPPGLGAPGQTNPDALVAGSPVPGPGVESLRTGVIPDDGMIPGYTSPTGGYNVITWDPRGEFASTGILQLDNPAFEGQDVAAIIAWATSAANPANGQLKLNGLLDPEIGMVGGSYGGGIQLVAASGAVDPNKIIDAIVPGIAWNSLNDSLYPDGAFKTSYASLLLLSLVTTGARINTQIYQAVLTGDLLGFITQAAQAILTTSGPGPNFLLPSITAPTLYVQGTADVLFTLQQAVNNAMQSASTDQRMIWFCGGHGACLNPVNPNQAQMYLVDTMKWLDHYVAGEPAATTIDTIPNFQWADQNGAIYKSDYLPFDSNFEGADALYTSATAGGLLGIVPILGGSGPAPQASLPYSLGLASKALNAVSLTADVGSNAVNPQFQYIAGAPTISFKYSGIGTSRFVYAQLVDDATGLVVGNLVTPIPVTLDGKTHTIDDFALENISYTAAPGDKLTLQITSSATAYENFTSFGVMNISDIGLTLPYAKPGAVTLEYAAPLV